MRSRIHALHSTRTPSANRAHHNGRTAGHWNADETIHHTIYLVTNLFFQPMIPSQVVPLSPVGRHARGAASVGPAAARARPVHMLQEAARARCLLPRLPDYVDSAPAEARCHLRWPSARASAPPRLFC